MKQETISACPLDCWDQCSLRVGIKDGQVLYIRPDPDHPVTGGFFCSKGKKLISRVNHPERLRYPLLKKNGSFKRVSWDEALELMAEKITETLKSYGPLAMMHFYDGGHGGLIKNIESRFFSALGGSTTHRGSLCWSAGLAAQRYDFGEVMSHAHQDLVKAKLIIIWGRNPADTQTHLLPFIHRARAGGTKVILIDPVRTATAALADRYYRIFPASDGALALGLAGEIIRAGLIDTDFVNRYSSGFNPYAELCKDFSLERTAAITGLKSDQIKELARDYALAKPAAILIGIGPQRHSNGGNSIRAIDALAALTGNIGVPGGGASYANFRTTNLIDHAYLDGDDLQPRRRYYAKPQFAQALSGLKEPPVAFLYISRANPMVQVGDSEKLRRALSGVPFIVTAEHFMTDTAMVSDLVLPVTSFIEEDDLFFNSMSHQYITATSSAVTPPGECRVEYEYLSELALRLGLNTFPNPDSEEIISRAIRPLTAATGLTLKNLKDCGPTMLPGSDAIPWSDRVFHTSDGKYNFYSTRAEKEGAGGLPEYHSPREISNQQLRSEGFRYWLVTPHHRHSIHSCHRIPGNNERPLAYISPKTACREDLVTGKTILLESRRGAIQVEVEISEMVDDQTILVYEGWWHRTGAAVNVLTGDHLTDIGNQAALYDCLCRIGKAE